MNCDYIIVQAGGKGTRMEKLTVNKPKALVPINNLPIIMHLFKRFPDKKYIIIGDYKFDVLDKYLHAFSNVEYNLVCATGKNGTCAGLKDALSLIPNDKRFMLIWCDLLLPEDFEMINSENNVIGISKDFECRWKYESKVFIEEKSSEHGVAGYFVFKNKSYIEDVPEEGEFVRWLQSKNYIFDEQNLYKTREYGLISEWNKLPKYRCRPFNKIEIKDNKLYKIAIDDQGKKLAEREVQWYKRVQELNITNIPQIYEYSPLCMEFISGKNIYEYKNISIESKKNILKQIVDCLNNIHSIESIPADIESYRVAYVDKTFDRLEKVKDLVPFAKNETIIINGKKCKNIFYHKKELFDLVMSYVPKEFCLIHGDCTFSNIMLKDDKIPVFIDPRGYFGNTEIFGDEAYDWVKLYYSLISNYDQFNLKNFDLKINDNNVELTIESNNWESLEDYFFELLDVKVTRKQLKLFLAITWLSLTTYTWENYDSICGAFYIGLYYLEEVL